MCFLGANPTSHLNTCILPRLAGRTPRDLSIAGLGQENKSEEEFIFILFWGEKKKKTFSFPLFILAPTS